MSSKALKTQAVALMLEQLNRLIYEPEGPKGLRPAQWASLRFFATAGEQTRTVSGLATYMGITLAPASRTIKSLVGRGLLYERENPDDRRSVFYYLTEKGTQQLSKDPILELQKSVAELDGNQVSAFADMLIEIGDRLSHAKEGHPT